MPDRTRKKKRAGIASAFRPFTVRFDDNGNPTFPAAQGNAPQTGAKFPVSRPSSAPSGPFGPERPEGGDIFEEGFEPIDDTPTVETASQALGLGSKKRPGPPPPVAGSLPNTRIVADALADSRHPGRDFLFDKFTQEGGPPGARESRQPDVEIEPPPGESPSSDFDPAFEARLQRFIEEGDIPAPLTEFLVSAVEQVAGDTGFRERVKAFMRANRERQVPQMRANQERRRQRDAAEE